MSSAPDGEWTHLHTELRNILRLAETCVLPLNNADVAHVRTRLSMCLHALNNRNLQLPIVLHATMVFLDTGIQVPFDAETQRLLISHATRLCREYGNWPMNGHNARVSCMSHVLSWGEAVVHFNAQDNMQKVRYVLVNTLRALLVDVDPHNAARFEPVIQHILRSSSTESAMRQALQEARAMCSNAVQPWIVADALQHVDAHGVPAYTAAHNEQEEETEEQHALRHSEHDLYSVFCTDVGRYCYGQDLSYRQWRTLPHVQREREIRNIYRRQNGLQAE
jgi:hypothetical protein